MRIEPCTCMRAFNFKNPLLFLSEETLTNLHLHRVEFCIKQVITYQTSYMSFLTKVQFLFFLNRFMYIIISIIYSLIHRNLTNNTWINFNSAESNLSNNVILTMMRVRSSKYSQDDVGKGMK